jgi:hypothetical protein
MSETTTPTQLRPRSTLVKVLALVVAGLALAEAYEHHMIPGLNQPAQANAATASPSQPSILPAFLGGTAESTPTDTFVVGGVKKFPNGRVLVNDQPFPRQSKTVCLQPAVGQSVDEKALVGKTITVFVPLGQYQGKPEYQVDRPGQFSVK